MILVYHPKNAYDVPSKLITLEKGHPHGHLWRPRHHRIRQESAQGASAGARGDLRQQSIAAVEAFNPGGRAAMGMVDGKTIGKP